MNLPEIEESDAISTPYQSMFRNLSIENVSGSSSRYGARKADPYLSKLCIRDAYAGMPSGCISMLTIRKKT